ncbi:hypothetical protein ACFJIW_07755 [Tahibacter sp. UC22_41]|uniref:hypothetical protein n=1 Tax=Tahibacter sp. UC22_41 TaxID=3350178 RepID=UPI0036DC5372
MTRIAQDRIAAEQLAARVAATEAARRTLAVSGEPVHEVLLRLAIVVIWTVVASVLSRAELAWPSYALVVLAAFVMQLPLWLRARRLRRQRDAALLLLANYERPAAANEASEAPSPVSR